MTAPSSDSELEDILMQYSTGLHAKWLNMVSPRPSLSLDEAKAALLAWNEQRVRAARIDELKRAKMQGYIAGPLTHKIDRRIAALKSQRQALISNEGDE